eukprot:Gb_28828 [translate_table: standard]
MIDRAHEDGSVRKGIREATVSNISRGVTQAENRSKEEDGLKGSFNADKYRKPSYRVTEVLPNLLFRVYLKLLDKNMPDAKVQILMNMGPIHQLLLPAFQVEVVLKQLGIWLDCERLKKRSGVAVMYEQIGLSQTWELSGESLNQQIFPPEHIQQLLEETRRFLSRMKAMPSVRRDYSVSIQKQEEQSFPSSPAKLISNEFVRYENSPISQPSSGPCLHVGLYIGSESDEQLHANTTIAGSTSEKFLTNGNDLGLPQNCRRGMIKSQVGGNNKINSSASRQAFLPQEPGLFLNLFNWAKGQEGFKHDGHFSTVMIGILGHARKFELIKRKYPIALKLYRDMQNAGFHPDQVTSSIVMEVLGQCGHVEEAEAVFMEMRHGGGCEQDMGLFSSLLANTGHLAHSFLVSLPAAQPVAMEKNLYPHAVTLKAPKYWSINLHVMLIGTALVALSRTLARFRERMLMSGVEPDRIDIITGLSRHSRVMGSSSVKQSDEQVLQIFDSPFSVENGNSRCFVGFGKPLIEWLHGSYLEQMHLL